MQHGKEWEARAVASYDFLVGIQSTPCGFVTNDSRTVGASPDRFVGDDGLLEIKCPEAHTYTAYMLGIESPTGEAYRAQIQGQLWVCERQWVDFLAFHPELPPMDPIRVVRDEPFIAKLSAAVGDFSMRLEEAVAMLRAKGDVT